MKSNDNVKVNDAWRSGSPMHIQDLWKAPTILVWCSAQAMSTGSILYLSVMRNARQVVQGFVTSKEHFMQAKHG